MTKKDFELIARVLRTDRENGGVTFDELAWRFAEALRATNPRFDSERFLKACGVE